ncbi:MAG TPA: N-acetylmuramyl-L-alanine amidase [Nitrospinae bacterium]|nr:N-acetylmuramyl-L-alanine amidase [Nitrospinota bacterium]
MRWLCGPAARASAHLVLGRGGGQIVQLAPFNVETWHAGQSRWAGHSGLNGCSIGVEIANAGRLVRSGGALRTWYGATVPDGEALRARHKHEDAPAYWHAYTALQLERALDLARCLAAAYELADILGHEDISPGRKSDPAPAFPLEKIRAAVLDRAAEIDPAFPLEKFREVAPPALNIRIGPGTRFPLADAPLPRGARLRLLEERGGWSRVRVTGGDGLEGWVSSAYIRLV